MPVNDGPVLSAVSGPSVAENQAGQSSARFRGDVDTSSGLTFQVLKGDGGGDRRRLGRPLPCAARAGGPPPEVLIDSSAVKAASLGSAVKGERQAIGRSRGGRSTKIHALTDHLCSAHRLPADRRPSCRLRGGRSGFSSACLPLVFSTAIRAMTTHALRRRVEANGTLPNVPPKVNPLWKNCSSPSCAAPATPLSACSAVSRTLQETSVCIVDGARKIIR
jgi:hypothetical protein